VTPELGQGSIFLGIFDFPCCGGKCYGKKPGIESKLSLPTVGAPRRESEQIDL
jgi:hypothetical protein